MIILESHIWKFGNLVLFYDILNSIYNLWTNTLIILLYKTGFLAVYIFMYSLFLHYCEIGSSKAYQNVTLD